MEKVTLSLKKIKYMLQIKDNKDDKNYTVYTFVIS